MAEDRYPEPSDDLVKMMIGAQLHHAKLAGEYETMIQLIDKKIEGLLEQPEPDAGEINKLKRLKHAAELHRDRMRWGHVGAVK